MKFRVTGRLVVPGGGKPVEHHPLEPPLPGVGQMAMNAAGALGRAAGALVAGRRVVATPEERERWGDICRSNRCGFFRASDQRCAHPECGCFQRLKTWLVTERCPVGLWGARRG